MARHYRVNMPILGITESICPYTHAYNLVLMHNSCGLLTPESQWIVGEWQLADDDEESKTKRLMHNGSHLGFETQR